MSAEGSPVAEVSSLWYIACCMYRDVFCDRKILHVIYYVLYPLWAQFRFFYTLYVYYMGNSAHELLGMLQIGSAKTDQAGFYHRCSTSFKTHQVIAQIFSLPYDIIL